MRSPTVTPDASAPATARRWAWAAATAVLIVFAVAMAWRVGLRDQRVTVDDPHGAAEVVGAGWAWTTATTVAGDDVRLYLPPTADLPGRTTVSNADVRGVIIEVTSGSRQLAEFVRSWPGLRLDTVEDLAGGKLQRGKGDASVVLWEGGSSTVLWTTEAIDPQRLETIVRQHEILETANGAIVQLTAGRFDRHDRTVHIPMTDVGSIDVRPRHGRDDSVESGHAGRQVDGGTLYDGDDGSFVIVGDSATVTFTPHPGADRRETEAIAQKLKVEWPAG